VILSIPYKRIRKNKAIWIKKKTVKKAKKMEKTVGNNL